MKITLRNYKDNWQDVKNATMNTIGKDKGAYPSSDWKRRLLLSEHSPIRKLLIDFWLKQENKEWIYRKLTKIY